MGSGAWTSASLLLEKPNAICPLNPGNSNAELYFDEYSKIGSAFEKEFAAYLKLKNAGLPPHRLKSVKMLKSESSRLLQLADLVAGVIKNQAKKKFDLQYLIDDKAIRVQYWPRK